MEPRGLGRHPHPDTVVAALSHHITDHPDYKDSALTYRYWYEGGAGVVA